MSSITLLSLLLHFKLCSYVVITAKLWWRSCSFPSGSWPAQALCSISHFPPPVVITCTQVWIHMSEMNSCSLPSSQFLQTTLNNTWFYWTCYRRTRFALKHIAHWKHAGASNVFVFETLASSWQGFTTRSYLGLQCCHVQFWVVSAH